MRTVPRSIQRIFNPAALLSIAIASAGAGLLAGCDGAAGIADKQAEQNVADAAKEKPDSARAQALLGQAAGLQDESSPEAARTHGLFAQANLTSGLTLAREAEQKEMDIARLLAEIDQGLNQIQQMQAGIQTDAASNPQPVKDQLLAEIAAATGSDGSAGQYWNPVKAPQDPAAPKAPAAADAGGAPTPLHTVAYLDTHISQLQQQIKQNRDQVAQLNQQKTDAGQQADKLQQKSDGETGEAALKDYVSAVDLRKHADDLAVQIEKLDAVLLNLQDDLATCQSEEDGVKKAIAGYQSRIVELDAGWKFIQDDMRNRQQALSGFVGSDSDRSFAPAGIADMPPAPASLAGKIAELAVLLDEVRTLRGDNNVVQKFQQAVNQNEGAARACAAWQSDIQKLDTSHETPTELKNQADFKEAMNQAVYRLAEYNAELALAQNYSSLASTYLSVRAAMDRARQILGDATPDSVAKTLAIIDPPIRESTGKKRRNTEVVNAQSLIAAADAEYTKVLTGYDSLLQTEMGSDFAAESRKTAALAGKMLALYGAKELSDVQGGKAVAGIQGSEFQKLIDDQAGQIVGRDRSMLPDIPSAELKPVPIHVNTPTPVTPATPTPTPDSGDTETP